MTVGASFTPFQIMCADTMIQGISIDGVPLHTVGRVEQVWEDVLGSPELFGDAVHVPLRPGALDVPQVIGPREFTVGLVLYGAGDKDQAGHNTAWRDLARMLWSPLAPLKVQRTVRYMTGDETHECAAKFVSGLNPEPIVPGSMSRVALRFVNLDGYWYDPEPSVIIVDSNSEDDTVFDMPGDADTYRMTIMLSGGTGIQTLGNSDTGVQMTYNGDTVSAPADIDVLGFTATQDAVSGTEIVVTSVSGNMAHSGDTFWMRLRPGTNTFTLSGGGTATITARAAYL